MCSSDLIEEAISTATAHIIFITANFQIPVVAAEVVVNKSTVRKDVIVLTIASCAIISEVYIVSANAVNDFRAVVNLRISTNADTVRPRIIVLNFTLALVIAVLMDVTDTSVTGQFNVTDAVFQSAYANAEVVEFVSIFVSQFVDEGALFDRSFVHVSHSFCDHFSSFITSDVTVALEILAVDTLDDASVSEFYDGFVSPAVRRYVDERVSCECEIGRASCRERV